MRATRSSSSSVFAARLAVARSPLTLSLSKGERGANRGSVLVWVTLSLVLLIVVLALVINAGHFTSVKGELQNAVDSAALAGALQLTGNADELVPSDRAVDDFAGYHFTDKPGAFPVFADDVRLGEWRPPSRPGCTAGDVATPFQDSAGNHFCEVTARDAPAAFRINAVYASAARAGQAGSPGGGAIPVALGPFVGRNTADMRAEAIALTGGPCNTSCLEVPMVVGIGCITGLGGSACASDAPPDSNGPMYILGLSSTQVRSAGWSVFSDTAPSENQVCQFLKSSTGGCSSIELGSHIQIDTGQGNKFNGGCKSGSAYKDICDWFKPQVGQLVEVPVISYSGELNEACPSNYTADAWVVGTSTFKILAVNCSASLNHPDCVGAPYCTDTSSPCSQYASGKCVLAQLVCNHQSGERQGTGCAWTGTSPRRPVLVQTRSP